MSATSGVYSPPSNCASERTYPVPTYRVWLASGTTNGTSCARTRSASRLSCGSRNSTPDATRNPTTAAAAATAPGTRAPVNRSPTPVAAPTTGPSSTFCGRSPSAPAAAPGQAVRGPAQRRRHRPAGDDPRPQRGDLARPLPGSGHRVHRREPGRPAQRAQHHRPAAAVRGQRRPGQRAQHPRRPGRPRPGRPGPPRTRRVILSHLWNLSSGTTPQVTRSTVNTAAAHRSFIFLPNGTWPPRPGNASRGPISPKAPTSPIRAPWPTSLGPVRITSLGFRTDVALRALEGARITDRGDYLVVRTPSN